MRKKWMLWTSSALLTILLSACAGTGQLAEKTRVKCPSCGYQFEVPMEGGT